MTAWVLVEQDRPGVKRYGVGETVKCPQCKLAQGLVATETMVEVRVLFGKVVPPAIIRKCRRCGDLIEVRVVHAK